MPSISSPNPLLTLSLVLVAGVAFGTLAKRLRLPAVTGQILVGILIGPAVLHIFDLETIHGMEPFVDFALGLMAVAVGSHLYLRRMVNAKRRLAWLLLFEATLTPLLVFGLVIALPDTNWYVAALLASLAVSTAPATILALVKESRAKGVFVKTLVAGVALNNLVCICMFEVAHTVARASIVPARGGLGAVFVEILSAAALGVVLGTLLVFATRRIARPDRLAAASMVVILLTIGFTEYVGISTLLACLFLGVTLANMTPDREEIGHGVFSNFEYAIFAMFFTLAGMELSFEHIPVAGITALLMFAGRLVGKVAAGYFAMHLGGGTTRMRRYLGLALVPQAGLAVGLMLAITEDQTFPVDTRGYILAVVLTVVLANEILGPILTRLALVNSGDYGKDRARLIDFLHEEHILTDLDVGTKEEAITQLTDHLIHTNHLRVDRDELLEGILTREHAASTCLGDGLAIPHGPIKTENGEILGVMGISSDGLRFDTPDGHPVHCVVLLATPRGSGVRHLEVLAALARAIGGDRAVQQQLYHCKSPAHAYELLHAEEESEDWNHFLEDEEEESPG